MGAWVSEGSTEYDVKILFTKKPTRHDLEKKKKKKKKKNRVTEKKQSDGVRGMAAGAGK